MTAQNVYLYRAFGLVIRSSVQLWPAELALTRERPAHDVEFVLDAPGPGEDRAFSLGADDTALHVAGVGTLRVISGRRIEIRAEPGADPAAIASSAAGPGLAMLLHQRGLFTVHGSCVAIGSEAVCIAGASGVGKSTIAAALHRRGHTLVSDGMTVLARREEDGVVALQGPRCARLWPDAANHLGWRAESLPRVLPLHEKRLCTLEQLSNADPVILRTVLATATGDARIERLGGSARVMALLKNAFLVDWIDAESAPTLLEESATFAAAIRVDALFRGNVLEDLHSTIGLLERLSADHATARSARG